MLKRIRVMTCLLLAVTGSRCLADGYPPAQVALSHERLSLAQAAPQQQAQPTLPERVANLKAWMTASQQQLRTYQWIETTVVLSKGEEKSRKQNTCYYGADGKVQKVPIGDAAEEKSGGPPGILIPGKLIKKGMAKKKEEMTAYMQSAVQLVQSYVPPDPALIQRSMQAGKVSLDMLEPNRRLRLTFGDYLKAGDKLSMDMELPTNRLLGVSVSSYLDSPSDAVQLTVTMSVLPDGTIYTAGTVLNAPAKELTVKVDNSGYRKM